jgi:hypothetical protein
MSYIFSIRFKVSKRIEEKLYNAGGKNALLWDCRFFRPHSFRPKTEKRHLTKKAKAGWQRLQNLFLMLGFRKTE